MKTKYKHIHFVESQMFASLRQVWLCKNNKTTMTLAQLYYYDDWKQYVTSFNKSAVFSADCLADIQNFLNQLNKEL